MTKGKKPLIKKEVILNWRPTGLSNNIGGFSVYFKWGGLAGLPFAKIFARTIKPDAGQVHKIIRSRQLVLGVGIRGGLRENGFPAGSIFVVPRAADGLTREIF